MRAHPWVAPLVGSRPPLLPGFFRSFEFALGTLQRAGLEITEAAASSAAISAFVVGFVLLEHAEQEARRRTGLTKEQWRIRNAPLVERILADGKYPAVTRYVRHARDVDPDTAFGTALRRILDGLQASLPEGR
jgi:hypothetical protein